MEYISGTVIIAVLLLVGYLLAKRFISKEKALTFIAFFALIYVWEMLSNPYRLYRISYDLTLLWQNFCS